MCVCSIKEAGHSTFHLNCILMVLCMYVSHCKNYLGGGGRLGILQSLCYLKCDLPLSFNQSRSVKRVCFNLDNHSSLFFRFLLLVQFKGHSNSPLCFVQFMVIVIAATLKGALPCK